MTRTKPTYKHQDFVLNTEDERVEKENKRLWLSLRIEEKSEEGILVILKNPSRATKDISDKTVFNVTNYIHKNKRTYPPLENIGMIIIANLIPYYETYANLLATSRQQIIDEQNQRTIAQLASMHKNVIIAWGNHPKGLHAEYEELKRNVFGILRMNGNNVFHVGKISRIGNPKHGQVWGYKDELSEFIF